MTIRYGIPASGETFDVCVVGAGPAGLGVALSCGRRGLSVLVLEGGGPEQGAATPAAEILDPRIHVGLGVSTRSGLGGTSAAWGGGCVPYDPIDFEAREGLPDAGWPIGHAEVSQWTQGAASFLNCGSRFEDAPGPVPIPGIDTGQIGRLTRRPAIGAVYREELEASRTVTVCLGVTVERLVCDAAGEEIAGLDISVGGAPARVAAQRIVLAGGGLRSTHLLLKLSREWPGHFAGGRAPLGRHYMGHLGGEIASIVFHRPADAAPFLYAEDENRRWVQRRLKLPAERLRVEGIAASAFILRAPWLGDHRHHDGGLSAIALAGLVPGLARRVHSERFDGAVGGMRGRANVHHLRNILAKPVHTAQSLRTMLKRRRVRNLPIMLLNPSGRYALRFHSEQVPVADSRVFLDRDNPERLIVDFRYAPLDYTSVLRCHEILDEALRASGVGYVEYRSAREERYGDVVSEAHDGYHQIGTTRMSDDPKNGIVDRDCRVHGFDNLFVASSSTFASSSSANPTLTIVAMALRLGAHLAALAERERHVPVGQGLPAVSRDYAGSMS